MAQTGAHSSGDMDIQDQKETFNGFLTATVWMCAHIAQYVALFVLAFAIGAGWWAGLMAFVAIGVGAGLIFKMPGAWWAAQIIQWVLLGIGGIVIPALAGMMG